jgi:hypothetical protein
LKNNNRCTVVAIILLLTASLIVATINNSIPLAQAKKSVGHSTTTKASKPGGFAPGGTGGGFAEEPAGVWSLNTNLVVAKGATLHIDSTDTN